MSYADIVPLNEKALASLKFQNMAKLAVQDDSDDQIELVEIVKAEREEVRCGVYYHLSLKVKQQKGRTKFIKKVVWKGRLMEVIGFSEPSSTVFVEENSPIIPLLDITPMISLSGKALEIEKIVKAAKLCRQMHEKVVKDQQLRLSEVVEAECGTMQLAKAKGKLYALTLFLEECINKSSRKIIKTWVWDRKWTEILKKPNYSSHMFKWDSINPKKKCPKKAPVINAPRDRFAPRPQLYTRSCGGEHKLTKKERHSSEVECVARLVLNNHNFKKGGELEFIEVGKGTRQMVAGYLFKLTIMVNDHGINKIFKVTAWMMYWTNFWELTLKFITEVKPHSKSTKDGMTSRSRKRKAIL